MQSYPNPVVTFATIDYLGRAIAPSDKSVTLLHTGGAMGRRLRIALGAGRERDGAEADERPW